MWMDVHCTGIVGVVVVVGGESFGVVQNEHGRVVSLAIIVVNIETEPHSLKILRARCGDQNKNQDRREKGKRQKCTQETEQASTQ